MIATSPRLTLAGETGYVAASEVQGGWCFVPESCVQADAAGRLKLDEVAYLQSGWAVRNMRFNGVEAAGGRLYPRPGALAADPGLPTVADFLNRIRAARAGVARRPHV